MFNRKRTYDLKYRNNKKNKTPKKLKLSEYKGLLLGMISGFFYATAAVIVKEMKNIDPGQLAIYRFLAIFVFSLPEAVKCQKNLLGPKNLSCILILRGVFGAVSLYLTFVAFRYLPIGEAFVIISSVPVFVTVAARIFLKEPCGIFQMVTVFSTGVGILFTTNIPMKLSASSMSYSKETIWGLLAAIGSLLFNTFKYIFTRNAKSVHHSIIQLHSAWVAIVIIAVFTEVLGDFKWHDCGYHGFFIIILGIVSYAGQTLLTIALQCEFAGPVSTMRSAMDIVISFLWQILLFQEFPSVFGFVGAVLVGLSVIFVGVKKWVSMLPSDSYCAGKFRWMLK